MPPTSTSPRSTAPRLQAQRRWRRRLQRHLGRLGRRRQRRRLRRPDRRRFATPDGLRGASYVVFGKASGFAANIDLSSLDGATGFKLSGVAAVDGTGSSVASAGDVNGDGFADVIVGAYQADANGILNSGASYVVFGRLPDTAVNRTGTDASQTLAGGDFGDTLSGLGGDDCPARQRRQRHARRRRRQRHDDRRRSATTSTSSTARATSSPRRRTRAPTRCRPRWRATPLPGSPMSRTSPALRPPARRSPATAAPTPSPAASATTRSPAAAATTRQRSAAPSPTMRSCATPAPPTRASPSPICAAARPTGPIRVTGVESASSSPIRCSLQPSSPPTSTCRASTAPTASSSAARR